MRNKGGQTNTPEIAPVILSGGSGSRLWPISRATYPKQLQALVSDHSMIAETAQRLCPGFGIKPPVIICNRDHRFIVAEQFREINISPRAIILEPCGRNTAPAAALGALFLSGRANTDEQVLAVMPADHVISQLDKFRARISEAARLAAEGYLVTLGIEPTSARTGYGYIEKGEAIQGHPAYRVASFTEKPSASKAETFVASRTHLWNSGIFLFRPASYMEELERFAPDILDACRNALSGATRDMDFLRIGRAEFETAPNISIDYAVMERTKRAAVIPADFGWSDVGSWSSIWEISEKNESGNVFLGDVITKGVSNSYVRTEQTLVAAIGVENLTIVASDDAVLVVDKEHVEDVKDLVEELKAAGRSEHSHHLHNYRPWGHYRTIKSGHRYRVKHLLIKPGHKISLQLHHHRAEHWVVVSGTARITRGEEAFLLTENESTYIPIGVKHRIENLGKVPLDIIEVQSGTYLEEDDIVRFEDLYHRNAGD